MRFQWSMILGLIFSLIVAIFAVVNVSSVKVNYLFGYTEIPLILIIIGSALLGGLVVGMFGILRQYKLQRTIKRLEKEIAELHSKKSVEPEMNLENENATDNLLQDEN
ncbi:LapA family protein [Neobacillus sp. D3-1R]|uniref:LapA family protein n=1 Tax=Neobacillus sp. D3-1R TaxID=3445778 RepID=UPI003F9F0E37